MADTHDERRSADLEDPVEQLRIASALTADTEAELLALRAAAVDVERELAAIVLERAAIDEERVTLLERVRVAEAVSGDLRHEHNLERDAWSAREAVYRGDIGTLQARLFDAEQDAASVAAAKAADDARRDAERDALEARVRELEEAAAALAARVQAETALRRQAERWSVRHRVGVVAHKLPFVGGRRRLQS